MSYEPNQDKIKGAKFLIKLFPFLLLAVAAVAFFSALFSSCSSADCSDNRNSLPLAGFFAVNSQSGRQEQVAVDGLTVYGVGAPRDSLLTDSAGVQEVYLPFRIQEHTTSFIFDFGSASDEVTFSYNPRPRFVSSECGVVYDYEITSVETTHELIDSVTVPGGVITNTPGINVNIYLRSASRP